MPNIKLEQIVEDLFIIIPLLKRKLPKAEPFMGKQSLSPSHHQILFLLDDLGEQSISDIVKALGIIKTNITPLIEKLAAEGFVARLAHPSDRRYINISLTPAGTEYLEQVKKHLSMELREKLAHLGDAELDVLMSSLKNVKDLLAKI